MLSCKLCNNKFKRSKYVRHQEYCSERCRMLAKNKRRRKNKDLNFERECRYCRTGIITNTHNKIFCSKVCCEKSIRAEKYGLSITDFQTLQTRFNCDICGVILNKNTRCTDHCHTTNKVRGVLCRDCNVGLGNFKDDTSVLKKAITYLYNEPIKRRIIDTMRIAYDRGWITCRDGNVSVRSKDVLYITNSGANKSNLCLDDISVINIKNGEPDLGDKKISIEFMMHWLILKFKENGSVMHLHPTHTVACMEHKIELSKVSESFPELRRYTSIGKDVEFIEPGKHELARSVARNIAGFDLVGLRRHGVTAYGDTIDLAFQHIERLEHICQIVLSSGVRPDKI